MTEEQAISNYNKALAKIRKCPTVAQGGARAELEYANAGQQLIALGIDRQIRKKYRAR